MQSRGVIEQAKGIVMGELRYSPDKAFEHLVRLSDAQHRKLRDVAQLIVEQVQSTE